jgi:hypothetical protein
MPEDDFTINANIKAAGTSARAVHQFVSGVDDDVDSTKVRPTNWNAEHLLLGIPTKLSMETFTLNSLETKTWADADIARVGIWLIATIANDGVGMVQFYRHGTFNTVIGVQGGSFVFRGTTFSAGSNNTGFHFYISANTTGATLNLKNTQAFGRTFMVYRLYGDGSVGGGPLT